MVSGCASVINTLESRGYNFVGDGIMQLYNSQQHSHGHAKRIKYVFPELKI